MLGVAVGYLFHGSAGNEVSSGSSVTTQNPGSDLQFGSPLPIAATIQPLLERLSQNPNDPELLANIGNQYYDGHDYSKAVEYYSRLLKLRPENVNVRTDMATAIWYSGDADRAIREYETSLKYQPNHSQTLFNMGIVKWQGKHDGKGALEVWRKLLAINPNYPDRAKVEQLIQQAQQN
jgi:cytochrome c-type biogenesis protein CcmH/NrfG